MSDVNFSVLLGKTLVRVEKYDDDEMIIFEADDGSCYEMRHRQDCCENVYIESIVGDLQDLIGTPILMAEENSSEDPNASESGTFTFYKLASINGYVDIRWYGASNGYYSERVDFIQTEEAV